MQTKKEFLDYVLNFINKKEKWNKSFDSVGSEIMQRNVGDIKYAMNHTEFGSKILAKLDEVNKKLSTALKKFVKKISEHSKKNEQKKREANKKEREREKAKKEENADVGVEKMKDFFEEFMTKITTSLAEKFSENGVLSSELGREMFRDMIEVIAYEVADQIKNTYNELNIEEQQKGNGRIAENEKDISESKNKLADEDIVDDGRFSLDDLLERWKKLKELFRIYETANRDINFTFDDIKAICDTIDNISNEMIENFEKLPDTFKDAAVDIITEDLVNLGESKAIDSFLENLAKNIDGIHGPLKTPRAGLEKVGQNRSDKSPILNIRQSEDDQNWSC